MRPAALPDVKRVVGRIPVVGYRLVIIWKVAVNLCCLAGTDLYDHGLIPNARPHIPPLATDLDRGLVHLGSVQFG